MDSSTRNTRLASTGEAARGLKAPGGRTYHDGLGFLVNNNLGVRSAKELGGATICIQAGTTTELNVSDYFRGNNLKYTPITFDTSDESAKSLESGRCDVLTSDKSQLFAQRSKLAAPKDYVVLPETISKEPLGPVVRNGDDEWLAIVRWVGYAMLNAEEAGITSKNVEAEAKSTKNPDVARLLAAVLPPVRQHHARQLVAVHHLRRSQPPSRGGGGSGGEGGGTGGGGDCGGGDGLGGASGGSPLPEMHTTRNPVWLVAACSPLPLSATPWRGRPTARSMLSEILVTRIWTPPAFAPARSGARWCRVGVAGYLQVLTERTASVSDRDGHGRLGPVLEARAVRQAAVCFPITRAVEWAAVQALRTRPMRPAIKHATTTTRRRQNRMVNTE